MRKVLFLLFVSVFLLSACGQDDILSEDFESDIEQVLPIIEKAHKEQEEYTEHDSDLLEKFHNKYKIGQYYINETDGYYEMNDVEKSIFKEINTMYLFAVDTNETPTLASDKNAEINYYKEAAEELERLMKIKNVEKLPDELKDKYPTYEVINGLYPDKFKEDIEEIIELYEPIINGIDSEVNDKEWYPLVDFIEQYGGDDPEFPSEYEQDGKYYIVNKSMKDVIKMTNELRIDIDDGTIAPETMDHFDSVKEDLELFDNE